jgi:hypothetical protein
MIIVHGVPPPRDASCLMSPLTPQVSYWYCANMLSTHTLTTALRAAETRPLWTESRTGRQSQHGLAPLGLRRNQPWIRPESLSATSSLSLEVPRSLDLTRPRSRCRRHSFCSGGTGRRHERHHWQSRRWFAPSPCAGARHDQLSANRSKPVSTDLSANYPTRHARPSIVTM